MKHRASTGKPSSTAKAEREVRSAVLDVLRAVLAGTNDHPDEAPENGVEAALRRLAKARARMKGSAAPPGEPPKGMLSAKPVRP